jgi:hypothetical protein
VHSVANSEARRAKSNDDTQDYFVGLLLAAIAITLKVRLDTPEGPQPLARAIVTTHLQKLRSDLALP